MIDAKAEGVNPNPLSWNEISWPVQGNPPIETHADLIQHLQAKYPYIKNEIEDLLISAFKHMMEHWDEPGRRRNVFNFIEKWMYRNNESAIEADRLFRGANQ